MKAVHWLEGRHLWTGCGESGDNNCGWAGEAFEDHPLTRAMAEGLHDRLHDLYGTRGERMARLLKVESKPGAAMSRRAMNAKPRTKLETKAEIAARQELCYRYIRDVIDEAGPLGAQRRSIQRWGSQGGFTEAQVDKAISDLADDDEIFFRSSLAEPDEDDIYWKARDNRLFRSASTVEVTPEVAEKRKAAAVARKEERKARRGQRGQARAASTRTPVSTTARTETTAPAGSWMVEFEGKRLSFADKRGARAAARKAHAGGAVVVIKDGSGTVTNRYGS